jgi:hypothetical protein
MSKKINLRIMSNFRNPWVSGKSPTIDMVEEADGNSAKRDLSGSDDSDAGRSKPARRIKGEHSAVARIKSARSNRWGAVNDAAGEELPHPSSMSSETRDDDKQAPSQQRRTSSSSGGVSNNLRGNQDPVLAFGGKVKSLQSIKKDIFRSANTLKLPQGQESRVFHRSNFYDQNAVIRSASAYADFIIEDAYERGIPEEQRQCKSCNAEGIPSQEIKKA